MTVSAIIVNYFSSLMIKRAVDSIFESPVDSEIFVVDNSCNKKEINLLKDYLPNKVNFIFNDTNVGFAKACNQAYAKSKGKYILLLNPDAYLLHGSLQILCDFFEQQQDAGAVGPLSFWDDERTFVLPPNHMPNPIYDLLYSGQYKFPLISRLFYLLWRYKSIQTSRTNKPLQQDNLSGGGVLLKRDVIEILGGLFDESFFLYYEDSDLFLRMKRCGYKLFLEPKAKMVHHWNQSPEPNESKARLYERSNHYFMNKHYSSRNKLTKIVRNLLLLNNSLPKKLYNGQDMLSGISVPYKLEKSYLFEWSPHQSLFPAMLHFGEGPFFRFKQDDFSLLKKGIYYGRFSDPDSFYISNDYFAWSVD